MLTPAAMSNVSMPAPNASAIAAFSANGTSLPALAYGGRIYVLQDWAPAYVEYVPAYANASGVYSIALSLDQKALVVAPPGIMPQSISGSYEILAVNSTGTYIEVGPGSVSLSYYAIRLSLAPATPTSSTSTTYTSSRTYTSTTTQSVSVAQSTTQTTQLFGLNVIYITIIVVIIIIAIIVLIKKK
ncbi:MAG: hypothetical protein AT715_03830 [Thermoproteus sp. JCHS_4]|nr:MAG: hypothetical protein AT715_03830 [Thermoproteus sp. JCHS_4]